MLKRDFEKACNIIEDYELKHTEAYQAWQNGMIDDAKSESFDGNFSKETDKKRKDYLQHWKNGALWVADKLSEEFEQFGETEGYQHLLRMILEKSKSIAIESFEINPKLTLDGVLLVHKFIEKGWFTNDMWQHIEVAKIDRLKILELLYLQQKGNEPTLDD